MYNFSKLAETSKDSKNEKIMIIIKELFVNFPRFHRDFDLFVHRDTETQSFIRTQNYFPSVSDTSLMFTKVRSQKPHPCPPRKGRE